MLCHLDKYVHLSEAQRGEDGGRQMNFCEELMFISSKNDFPAHEG